MIDGTDTISSHSSPFLVYFSPLSFFPLSSLPQVNTLSLTKFSIAQKGVSAMKVVISIRVILVHVATRVSSATVRVNT